MNLLTLTVFTLLNLFLSGADNLEGVPSSADSSIIVTRDTCPVHNDNNQSIVENYLTDSNWTDKRTETGTDQLNVSQITLLTDSSDSSVCTSLNSTFQEAIDRENGLGESLYNVTYYKAGSFYFVAISIEQPSDQNYASVGVSFITVLDQNLNIEGAYAF